MVTLGEERMDFVMMLQEWQDLTQLTVQTKLFSPLLIPKLLSDSRTDSMRQVRSDVVLAPQRIRHTLGTPLPERAPKELVLIFY